MHVSRAYHRCKRQQRRGNNAPDAATARCRNEDGRKAAPQVLTATVGAASSVECVPRLKCFVQLGRHRKARADDVSEQRAHLLRQAARSKERERRV
jgi:hypothetical protein